jgi:hypothetical protein
VKTPFVRSPYNYDMDKASTDTGLECKDKTLAQQQFRDEVDINTMVERFGLTGEMPQLLNLPETGDFTGIFNFQSAMNIVAQAQTEFMTLPAKLRARFHNDPAEILEFLQDPENREEAQRLGLVKPDQPKPTLEGQQPAPETPDAPKKGKGGTPPKTPPSDLE